MTKSIINIFVLMVFVSLVSCLEKSIYDYSNSFDQKIWLENPDVGNGLNKNPRAGMIDDLIENHLKNGMTKSEVIELLGKPYKNGIEQRLPADLKVPDSLNIVSTAGESKEIRQKALDDWNNWYAENSQPDTLLLYFAGWSLIDPNFLVIKLNDKNLAYDFWLEQH